MISLQKLLFCTIQNKQTQKQHSHQKNPAWHIPLKATRKAFNRQMKKYEVIKTSRRAWFTFVTVCYRIFHKQRQCEDISQKKTNPAAVSSCEEQ